MVAGHALFIPKADHGSVHWWYATMHCNHCLFSIAALGTGLALLVQEPQPVQAQSVTRSVSTLAGQSLTYTHDQSGRTTTLGLSDGNTYSREIDRYRGGKTTVYQGPEGASFNREYSRENGTKTVTLTGRSGQSASRATAFNGQGQVTRTFTGPGGRNLTRSLGPGSLAP